MRALIRRVLGADVKVNGNVIGEISSGLVVYLGVDGDDEESDVLWVVNKILGLRIFEDDEGLMNQSVSDSYGILVISQFTLFGNLKKGFRPSFNRAAKAEKGEKFYLRCIDLIRANFTGKLENGQFGADMKVSSVDDGPVTIWLDSRNRNY